MPEYVPDASPMASKDAADAAPMEASKDAADVSDAPDVSHVSDAAAAEIADGGTLPVTCDFADRYEYGELGGLVPWRARSYLAPGNQYRHERTPLAPPAVDYRCTAPMPVCGSSDVVSAADVERDLAAPEVRAALAAPEPLLYGRDNRAADGTVFEFKRADGRGFRLGDECAGSDPCRPIPRALGQVAHRLRVLDRQQLSKEPCGRITRPPLPDGGLGP